MYLGEPDVGRPKVKTAMSTRTPQCARSDSTTKKEKHMTTAPYHDDKSGNDERFSLDEAATFLR